MPRLAPAVVYHKDRPSVTGDGLHSLLDLALAAMPAEQHSTVLPGLLADFGRAELDAVRLGQRRNPELAPQSRFRGDAGPAGAADVRKTCVELAVKAAPAIGIRFASIDVVCASGRWHVLEINSGPMMEALSKRHPELVYATYSAALDKVFE